MDSTTCRICGRSLTNPVSVEREIGPTCWGRLKRGENTGESSSLGPGMGLGFKPKKEAEA